MQAIHTKETMVYDKNSVARTRTHVSKSFPGTHHCPVLKIRTSELIHSLLILSNLSNLSVDLTLFGTFLGPQPCCTKKTERKNSTVKLNELNRTPKNLIRFVMLFPLTS